ncbi:MAG: ABC transporter ATP-binding protein [Puniceicoccales bacterium]|jgi:ABC-type glutathione transport system ATPase component|nr:ABC transporter ATP-binding protein [Puniceicoccales bacterium]
MSKYSPSLLAVKGLSVSFWDRRSGNFTNVLKNVHLHICAGQTLALTGASGSGKSTIALSIGRLLPPEARLKGDIVFEGKEIQNLAKSELRRIRGRKITYVFQEPMACFNPSIAVGNQILECILLHQKNLKKKAARHCTLDWLEKLQLPDPLRIFRSYPNELSGGMLQRAMLAMALCNGPSLLIADEPTSALDEKSCRAVVGQIQRLRAELSFSMLFVTHNISLAEHLADEIVLLKDGIVRSSPQ